MSIRFRPKYKDTIIQFVKQNDVQIEDMELSNRSRNQLIRNGLTSLSDIMFFTSADLNGLPAMGLKSIDEVIGKIDGYFDAWEPRILSFYNGDQKALFDKEVIKKKILNLFDEQPDSRYTTDEIIRLIDIPSCYDNDDIKLIIYNLIEKNELKFSRNAFIRVNDWFIDYIDKVERVSERDLTFLHKRLEGMTLDAIGQEYDLTRERVRQVINNAAEKVCRQYLAREHRRWFREDYYRYLFATYAFEKKDGSKWLDGPDHIWRYFEIMNIKQGSEELRSALEDQHFDVDLRLKIRTYLKKDMILIDGNWTDKKRPDIEKTLVRKYCQEDISFSDFTAKYNSFLRNEAKVSEEFFYYTDANKRARKNHLCQLNYLLWKQNEMMRYYDISNYDYSDLLDELGLESYYNTEVSTLKLMKEHPEILERYDIRDQYELHNLLRKIVPEGSFNGFHCSRMPMLVFGDFDRDQAIEQILMDHAPITADDFAGVLSDEFGYDRATAAATYLKCVSKYLHSGTYYVDNKVMSDENQAVMKEKLTDDFYYMNEIRDIYKNTFPDADLDEINPMALKVLGFNVYSNYVLQNYPSLDSYFEAQLTDEDVQDITHLKKRFGYLAVFTSKLMELKRNLEVIEFEPNNIITIRRLESFGISKSDIREYCDAVYDFVDKDQYFSIQYINSMGFASDLYDLGFTDWFYANLLLSDERFSFGKVLGTIALYKGHTDVMITSFIRDVVQKHQSIDRFDLYNELKELYGCTAVETYDIPYYSKQADLYYDAILDRVYIDESLYQKEIDNSEEFEKFSEPFEENKCL